MTDLPPTDQRETSKSAIDVAREAPSNLGALAKRLSRTLAVPRRSILIDQSEGDAAPRATLWPRMSMYWASFLALVAAPAFVSWIYFAFVASDQFVAEARFVVRMAQFDFGAADRQKIPTQAGSTASGPFATSITLAGQEAYVVAAYVRSMAIFDDLPKEVDVRAIYSRPEADFWERLPADAPREKLLKYWRRMVTTHVDPMSGAVGVSVFAFRADDALAVTKAVIEASEKLVNRLSERMRTDAMTRAEDEVRRNEAAVRDVLTQMRAYRDKEALIDPGSKAASTSALLLQMMSERIKLQNEFFALGRGLSPDAPTVVVLKNRLDAADQEIEKLKGQLTGGSEQRTVAAAIAGYEELELKRQFAERLYVMSQNALERARQKVEWQNVYLTVFVPPNLPQTALYPERISLSMLFPGVFLVIWGIMALTAATIRDHSQ
jgi:capsular polysaccharide transport system permease protein